MRNILPAIGLTVMLMCAILSGAQSLSSTDAVQNYEIATAQDLAANNKQRIDGLSEQVADLKREIEVSKAWVVGFGACLTFLSILLLLQNRNKSTVNLKGRY